MIQKLNFVLITLAINFCFSQNRTCGADYYMTKMLVNPVERKKHEDLQKRFEFESYIIQNNKNQLAIFANTIYVPVAIHFPEVSPSSPLKVCLRALAQSQINILNADYNATNADLATWTGGDSAFYPEVSFAGLNVQFVIATKNHPVSSGLSNGDLAITFGSGFTAGDSDNNWAGYINLVCKDAGVDTLGYSPVGGQPIDGATVVIDSQAFGTGNGCIGYVPKAPYNLGRTLTHELGHFFNLRHTFVGCSTTSNCTTAGDRVCDTPPSNAAVYGCPTAGDNIKCGVTTLTMNYMDYTNDACMYMFTAGQVNRMRAYYNTISSQLSTNVLSTNEFLVNNFSIFPSPNNGSFTIQLKEQLDNYEVEVFDRVGRLVFDNKLLNSLDLQQNITLENAQAGIYYVSIKSNATVFTKKIIVQ